MNIRLGLLGILLHFFTIDIFCSDQQNVMGQFSQFIDLSPGLYLHNPREHYHPAMVVQLLETWPVVESNLRLKIDLLREENEKLQKQAKKCDRWNERLVEDNVRLEKENRNLEKKYRMMVVRASLRTLAQKKNHFKTRFTDEY